MFFVAAFLPFFQFVPLFIHSFSHVDASQVAQLGGVAILVRFASFGRAEDGASTGAGISANQEVQQANGGTNGVDARGCLVAALAARSASLRTSAQKRGQQSTVVVAAATAAENALENSAQATLSAAENASQEAAKAALSATLSATLSTAAAAAKKAQEAHSRLGGGEEQRRGQDHGQKSRGMLEEHCFECFGIWRGFLVCLDDLDLLVADWHLQWAFIGPGD